MWKHAGEPGKLHSPLAYAAFEYRCAIERVILELYIMLHEVEPSVEDVNKIGSVTGLMSKTRELAYGNDRLLYRLLRFNTIMSEVAGIGIVLSTPSLGKLHGFWSKLSEYCHYQTTPDATWDSADWVERGYSLLNKVDAYLQEILADAYFGSFDASQSPEEVKEVRAAFVVDESLTEEQVRTRLELMKPVLEQRARSQM